MNIPTKQQINAIISEIFFSDKTSMLARSSNIIIKGNNIGFSADITGLDPKEAEEMRKVAEEQLQKIENIGRVHIALTSTREKSDSKKEGKPKLRIDGAKKVVMVAAGKGGVGKSTITALLAYKLKAEGYKVGIIDADIYGPSMPNMFSLSGKPELEDNKMIPLENHGIFVNSIGFLTAPSASISWRGPMTSKALYQLLSLTKWPDLDYLIIDSPPGTGDIHLSLLENYIIDSVLMVTTPQKISELDVSRAINLYKKFGVNIAGIIENMSYLESQDGTKTQIFSGNSGEEIASKHKLPLLVKLPISQSLSAACDAGQSLETHAEILDSAIII